MSMVKTLLATGASSGLGFELVKQLLGQAQPYRIVLGCRDVASTKNALHALQYDTRKHEVSVLPLELSDLKTVRTFASLSLHHIGNTPLDYLLLNAAVIKEADVTGPHGSKWSEQYLVNHLSQHYLCHFLRDKIVESHSRVVFVSSGAVRMVEQTASLRSSMLAAAKADAGPLYGSTKFAQLLGALWWRRQLGGSATVVAVSPGVVPDTGLVRHWDPEQRPTLDPKDAKSVSEGAQSILQAFTREDLPEDLGRIFLTSWGEWWDTDVCKLALDEALQDDFCPTLEAIEKEENLPSAQ